MTVDAVAGATIANTAALTAVDQPDQNGANDSSTASLTVNSVDLAVSKTVRDVGDDRGEFVVPGDPITYDVVVTLVAGNVPATGVTVTDVLEGGLSVGSLPSGCTADGQEITCTIADGDLVEDGDSVTVTYVAEADTETEGQELDNGVSVAANETDPVAENNTDSATVNVLPVLTCEEVLTLAGAGDLASVDIRLLDEVDQSCFPKGVLAGFSETGDFFIGFDGGTPVATRIDIRKRFDPDPGFDLPELLYAQVDPGADPVPPADGDFGDLPACSFRAKVNGDGDDFNDLIGNSLFPTLTGVVDIAPSSTAGQPATSCEVASSGIPIAVGSGFEFEQRTVVYGEFLDPWFR